MEDEPKERDEVDWLSDDETLSEGRKLPVEKRYKVHRTGCCPKTHFKRRDAGMIAGWSTQRLNETASRRDCEDNEEMVQWRRISGYSCAAYWRRIAWKSTRLTWQKRVLVKDWVNRDIGGS